MKLSCLPAYFNHYLQMRNSTAKLFFKKNSFCYISQWAISSSKNPAWKADRFVSIHFRWQGKKKGLWHMSCYFSKREWDRSL